MTVLTPDQVKTQIITGGISCLPACSGGLITSWIFSLANCVEVEIAQVGGAYPLAPGEIADLYKPTDAPAGLEDHPAFYVRPEDQDLRIKHHVIVRLKFGDSVTEKEFIVSPKRSMTIVRVANFTNRTVERMHVVANNFRRITKHVVRVTNFRKKWKK